MKKVLIVLLITTSCYSISCKKHPMESKQWKEINLPINGPLTDIQFISEDTGYILGLNIETGNRFNVLYKTTDGGNSWISKRFPYPEDGGVTQLYVVSSKEIYVGFHGVHRSIDDGSTWQDIDTSFKNIGTNICKINFNPKFPLIVLKGDEVYQYINNSFVPIFREPSGTSMKRAQTLSNTTLYVSSGAYPNYGVLNKSNDAGLTWRNIPFNYGFASFYFLNENIGYALTANDIYRTINGGQSWIKQNDNSIFNEGNFCFLNETEGYCTNQGEIYGTLNQGKTWGLEYKKDGIIYKKIITTLDGKLIAIGYNGTVLIK